MRPVLSGAAGLRDYVLALLTSNQTLSNATHTLINWTAESINLVGTALHDPASNSSRFYAREDGRYQVSITGAFDANGTGYRQMTLKKNGSNYLDFVIAASAGAAQLTIASNTITVKLAAGDYIEVSAYQTSGGNLDFRSSSSWLSFTYLGPN